MNVNVLTPTAPPTVLSSPLQSPLVLQQSLEDVQSLNIVPANIITQSTDVIPSNSACGHGNIQQSYSDDVRSSSLLNQDQVRL